MERIKRYIPISILAVLGIAAILMWQIVFYFEARQGKLFLSVLDVGQGDAIFIEAPDGNQILIDGGPDAGVVRRLGEIMLPWDRTIDAIILTHPHGDHLTGLLEVLKRYRVSRVIESGKGHSIPEYIEWRKIIEEKNIPLTIIRAGQALVMGDVFLAIVAPKEDVLASDDIHDSMVVVRLAFGSSTALLTGDSEKKIEYKLIASGDDITAQLLKVGHHGSKTSTADLFLSRVHPQFAVISVGRKNRYGHPHEEILERLRARNIQILRTDASGTITFMGDENGFAELLIPSRY